MQDALDKLSPELKEVLVPLFDRLVTENQLLREEIRLLRIAKYGPRSEKLSDAQLELLEGEPGVNRAEVENEIAQAGKDQAQPPRKPRARHPGRQEFAAHLERREIKIPCRPEDCVCPQCQGDKVIIGYERSEELGVIPAHYFVKVTLREKRACPLHPEEGVACASLPARIIPKSKLSDEMIADVLVRKYGDHLPAYRQSMILERDAGIEMSRKTLIGQIYHLEDQAREAGFDAPSRLAMRQQHIRPLVDELEKRILDIRAQADVLPASQLGKACGYAMGQWARLKVFLEHGRVEIDNNWCENAIRPLAVGRKNWLHAGSEEAGPRVAAIASIFETCRRLRINVRDYLLAILPKLPEWPMNRVAELSPMDWKARQPS